MKRVKIVGILSVSLIAIVAALMLALTQSARAAVPQALIIRPIAAPNGASSSLAPTQLVTCRVSISPTQDSLGGINRTSGTAATIASYTGLALVDDVVGIPGITITLPVSRTALDAWFVLDNATPNFQYTIDATPDNVGNYNLGMEIYTGTTPLQLLFANVDTGDGTSARLATSFPGPGPYYVRIFQISAACSGGYYHLTFSYTSPTLTPSLTPTPTRTPSPTKTIGPTITPYAGAPSVDAFEPNNDFDHATTLGLGVKYDNLNFVQWDVDSEEWDNDFFKVRVKPGMLITCHTLNLAAGTDTNLILYDDSRNGINGSDDVNRANGDLSSSVTYYTTFEGWLYALVGEGFSRPLSEQQTTKYSFECIIGPQSTATPTIEPTAAPGVPTRTPVPPTPTMTLTPSPTLSPTPPFIKVLPLPTVTPPGLPMTNIPVSLQVYYDANSNNKPDPGEGVVGVSARVFDLVTGRLLAQQLTDETGRVSFTVSAPGAVQLVVPYLNFSTIILPSGGAAVIRVSGSELPESIP